MADTSHWTLAPKLVTPFKVGIKIPYKELSDDLLNSVIESFVLREGTDYGDREISLDAKVAQVRRQLEKGDAQLVFDPETESVSILCPRDVR